MTGLHIPTPAIIRPPPPTWRDRRPGLRLPPRFGRQTNIEALDQQRRFTPAEEEAAAGGISFVGGTTAAVIDSGTATVTLNSGLTGGSGSAALEDDYVVLFGAAAFSQITPKNITNNGSWGSISAQIEANDSHDSTSEVFGKVMGATPDTSVGIDTDANSQSSVVAIALVFRGVDTTTPMDVSSTRDEGTNAAAPDHASITPITSGAWVVMCGAVGHDSGSQTFSWAGADGIFSDGENDTDDCAAYAAYYDGWSSGAFDPNATLGNPTFSGTSDTGDSWLAHTLALRPA